MKPLIGITCGMGLDIRSLDMQHLPVEQHRLDDAFMKAVERAGGIPVLIPVYDDLSLVQEAIDRLDGIILSGGGDPDPALFGRRATARQGAVLPRRDAFDFEVVRYAICETKKPVLGICRGEQMMNVAMGGTLHIDLREDGKLEHRLDMFPREMVSHEVEVLEGTRLAQMLGAGVQGVNSLHHEAVENVGEGFVVSVRSIPDNVVEAIEMPGERFVVGVQWHPEELVKLENQQNIIRCLVEAAGK